MEHVAESQHWYERDGSPAYTTIGKNGKERPVTLRDARVLDLVPSVTGVIKMMDAPGLTIWKIRQAVMSALTHPTLTHTDEDVKTILADARQEGMKAAERGTAIHAACQGYFEGETVTDYLEHAVGAQKALDAHFGPQQWNCEQAFAHPMGFGGKCDLNAKDGNQLLVVDFKSKEFGPDDKLDTWDEHHCQLAAYSTGIYDEMDRAAICYVSATHPGLSRVIELTAVDLHRGWTMFSACLALWKAKNRFDASWMRPSGFWTAGRSEMDQNRHEDYAQRIKDVR